GVNHQHPDEEVAKAKVNRTPKHLICPGRYRGDDAPENAAAKGAGVEDAWIDCRIYYQCPHVWRRQTVPVGADTVPALASILTLKNSSILRADRINHPSAIRAGI